MYVLGALTALIIFGLLALHHLPTWHKIKGKGKRHPHPEDASPVKKIEAFKQ